MNAFRRLLMAGAAAGLLAAAGCSVPRAPDTAARSALAPTGTLRVGVYPGSPTSLVRDRTTGEPAGVAHDLGQALGAELGVPVRVVEFARVAQVVDALKDGQVDFTFTNASPARVRIVDFTQPVVGLELGYLAGPDSVVRSISDVDRAGVRIGVTQGSTSQGTLSRAYRNAVVVPVPSLAQAQAMLVQHAIDAFATNKAILYQLSDAVPGSKVLDGRWGVEHMAIAIPKGRDAALPYLQDFAQRMKTSGRLAAIVQRAGLRGTAAD